MAPGVEGTHVDLALFFGEAKRKPMILWVPLYILR